MSRPCLSVKPPDICVLRLPGGVAGRLKAGDWSESADGASSGHAAARSGSVCEPLSILVPGSTCRSSGDVRSRCSAPGPWRAPGRQGTEAHPPGDACAHDSCWEGARGSARQSELQRRHLPALHGGLHKAERQKIENRGQTALTFNPTRQRRTTQPARARAAHKQSYFTRIKARAKTAPGARQQCAARGPIGQGVRWPSPSPPPLPCCPL